MPATTAMTTNTAMSMILTSCKTKMHNGNLAKIEVLCIRVANLLKKNMQAYLK